MRLTPDSNLKKVPLVLVGCCWQPATWGSHEKAVSGSSPTGDKGASGGPCKNVAICTVIPQAQVNTSLGVTALNCISDEPTYSGRMTSDHSAYLNAKDKTNVQLLRQCYSS